MSSEEEYQLSEYELLRLERIRKNEERLEQLGLKSAKAKLMAATTRKTKRNQQRSKVQRVKPGEERRSNRINNKADSTSTKSELLMLSYVEEDDLVAVQQEAYYASPSTTTGTSSATHSATQRRREGHTPAGKPTSFFRSARRLALQQDYVLTEQEKKILSQNTMDANYLHKFQEFLVHHNQISAQNVANVMRQVSKLASGQGIRYESSKYGWKPHQVFQKGIPITPLSDFVRLMELAQQAEHQWGRDHGNGWLLSHPLKKLLLFQQFCLQNPDFLSAQCRLTDYYHAMDNDHDNGSGEEEANTSATEPETETAEDGEDTDSRQQHTVKANNKNDKTPTPKKANQEPATNDSTPPKSNKKRGAVTRAASGTSSSSFANQKKTKVSNEPQQHIGRRVAKEFNGQMYRGTVLNYRTKFWWIQYEDGDEEEMNATELQQALDLFAAAQQR